MLTQIRQQGHIAEHTHEGPRDLQEGLRQRNYAAWAEDKSETWYDTEDAPDDRSWSGLGQYLMTSDAPRSEPTQSTCVDEEGWPFCPHCHSYLYEVEENGEDTDSEDEPDMTEWTPEEYHQYFGKDLDDY